MIKKRTEYKMVFGCTSNGIGHEMTMHGLDGWFPAMPIVDSRSMGYYCPMTRVVDVNLENIEQMILCDWDRAPKNGKHEHDEFDRVTAVRYKLTVTEVCDIVTEYESTRSVEIELFD